VCSMRKWFGILRSAYTDWTATLGTIIAIVALSNLLFKILDSPITETLAWIFSQYRKTFHPPIDLLLSVFSLHLPALGKDALVLYLAMAGVLFRTLSYRQSELIRLPAGFRWNGRALLMKIRVIAGEIVAALLWPRVVGSILRNPSVLVVSNWGYHGRLPPPRARDPVERQRVMEKMLAMTSDGAGIHCTDRQLLISYFATLLAAASGLVCLNAAIDLLSG
jgi:hypothetical protein